MIGAYHAVYFDDVGSAVGFCHDLVPHITPKAAELLSDDSRPVVWFHVPRRSTNSSRDGCYLLLSSGAVRIAQEVGLDVPVSGIIARASLPLEAVPVFGEDTVERHPDLERRRAARTIPGSAPVARRSATSSDLIATPS